MSFGLSRRGFDVVASFALLLATAVGQGSSEQDCGDDSTSWELAWSIETKAFCCRTAQKACEPWDCDAGLDAALGSLLWPASKSAWCCNERGKGCAGQQQQRLPPAELFDCSAGADAWEVSWNLAQKTWCCEHAGVACDPYNCDEDAEWTPIKKTWCCENKGVACSPAAQEANAASIANAGTPPPIAPNYYFDCDQGADQWEEGWSSTKKAWCCDRSKVACDPYDCRSGVGDPWPSQKADWCCTHTNKGCPTTSTTTVLPSHYGGVGGDDHDCDLELGGAKFLWSPTKKVECCIREGKGCPQVSVFEEGSGDSEGSDVVDTGEAEAHRALDTGGVSSADSGFQFPFGLGAIGLARARPTSSGRAARRWQQRGLAAVWSPRVMALAATGLALLLASAALGGFRTWRAANVGLEGYWPAPGSPGRPRPTREGYRVQQIECSSCFRCV